MRLTLSLMKKVMPKGNIRIGKYRIEFRPDAKHRSRVITGLKIEEQNMLYLRHPFLTVKQSRGHALELKEMGEIESYKPPVKKWWEPIRLEDKLNHLRHAEKWDC